MRLLFLIFLSFLLLPEGTIAQQKRKAVPVVAPPPAEALIYVEEPARFRGNLEVYVRKNLRYSRNAYIESHPHKQWAYSGCVAYSFIPDEVPTGGEIPVCFLVDTNGSLREITLLKSLNPVLDEAVLKMMQEMPLWKPGRRQGCPVMEQVNIVVAVPPLLY